MADTYIPSSSKLKLLEELPQGFLLDRDENRNIVLIIKQSSSVIDSILHGCNL